MDPGRWRNVGPSGWHRHTFPASSWSMTHGCCHASFSKLRTSSRHPCTWQWRVPVSSKAQLYSCWIKVTWRREKHRHQRGLPRGRVECRMSSKRPYYCLLKLWAEYPTVATSQEEALVLPIQRPCTSYKHCLHRLEHNTNLGGPVRERAGNVSVAADSNTSQIYSYSYSSFLKLHWSQPMRSGVALAPSNTLRSAGWPSAPRSPRPSAL